MMRIVVQASLATAALAVAATGVALVLALLAKGVWSSARRLLPTRPDPDP